MMHLVDLTMKTVISAAKYTETNIEYTYFDCVTIWTAFHCDLLKA